MVKFGKFITKQGLEHSNAKLYVKGYVLIALVGATIGKVGRLGISTTTNQACCVLPPIMEMNSSYVFYIMLASKTELVSKSAGGGQPNISQAIIKKHLIPTPPLSEQRAIADYLDDKTRKIDEAITRLEQVKELQAQYKQSLISEAVTGKIDVRDWIVKKQD